MDDLSSFFPTPYPNEDFRSVLYRYHHFSRNSDIYDTNKELFGTKSNFTLFPRALEILINKLPTTVSISTETIIDQNTLLPSILPFVSEIHIPKIFKELKHAESSAENNVGKLSGNKYGKNVSDYLKYCPSCLKEDILNFGCGYIHREHQYAFINECSKHSVKLITHCPECGILLSYSPLTERCKNGHIINTKFEVQDCKLDNLKNRLMKDLDYLLNNGRNISRYIIVQKIWQHLNNKGYIGILGNTIFRKKLINDFTKYYSSEFLSSIGLDVNYISQYYALERIFKGQQLTINLPLTILFIGFLAESVENFLKHDFPYVCQIPFGNGPWYCENKLCPKFKQKVISRCTRTCSSSRQVRCAFVCNYCDTFYVNYWRFNDGSKKEVSKSKEIIHLDKKKEEILNLLKKGSTIEEISKTLYCEKNFVKKTINKNLLKLESELFFDEHENFNKPSEFDRFKINRYAHRSRILLFLEKNRNSTRTEIKNTCQKAYRWLYEYDFIWLEKFLPPSRSIESKKKSNIQFNIPINIEIKLKHRANLITIIKENKGITRIEIAHQSPTVYQWLNENDYRWFDDYLLQSEKKGMVIEKDLKIEHRKTLGTILKNNNGLTRTEIKEKCKPAYLWLQIHDLKWLEKQLPPSKCKPRSEYQWNKIDYELVNRIKEISSQLICKNPNKRVAKSTIINALNKKERGRINNFIKQLPKTNQALSEYAETKEQYQIRHLPALVQQLRTHYNYAEVTLDTIMSYRRSYRGISDEMKEILKGKLIELN